jgi:Tetracyclin repressor-like, C-terminal domain
MAKKKKISLPKLIDLYMDEVVRLQAKPTDIASFTTAHNFEEDAFYEHFESFVALDREIFKILFDTSVATLIESPDFISFEKKDKLLSLFYTFFENLTLNRDFVITTIGTYNNQLKALSVFSDMKTSFSQFMGMLNFETISLQIEAVENLQKTSITEGAWVQLLLTIKFWMSDTSTDFQKTDIFIEKSINTSVELLNTQSFHNILDLGKFLYNEKFKT